MNGPVRPGNLDALGTWRHPGCICRDEGPGGEPAGSVSFSLGCRMPTISMFFGIIVQMFVKDDRRHHLPHIHVRYAGSNAAVAVETGELLAGDLPTKQLRLVQAWLLIHQDELLADWDLSIKGEQPFRIDPLR